MQCMLIKASCSIDKIHEVIKFAAGGFWAVIISQAMWKRSWVGRDPAPSKMAADRSIATTGIAVRAQQLTA